MGSFAVDLEDSDDGCFIEGGHPLAQFSKAIQDLPEEKHLAELQANLNVDNEQYIDGWNAQELEKKKLFEVENSSGKQKCSMTGEFIPKGEALLHIRSLAYGKKDVFFWVKNLKRYGVISLLGEVLKEVEKQGEGYESVDLEAAKKARRVRDAEFQDAHEAARKVRSKVWEEGGFGEMMDKQRVLARKKNREYEDNKNKHCSGA